MSNKYLYLALFLMSFMSAAQGNEEEYAIAKALDTFHKAAAAANTQEYLNLLTDDAIFLGTDPSERWTKKQFTAFVLPYFKQGKGWLYEVRDRNISMLDGSSVAFFDEILENSNYGLCRGSGVLIHTDQGWKISQYSLSVLVPNGVAEKVVAQIKNYELEK